MPPLRDHPRDIALLAGYFCDEARQQLAIGPVRLSAEAIDRLERYPWPGNVRELKNVLSRATLKAAFDLPRGEPVILTPHHLGADFSRDAGSRQGDPVVAQVPLPPTLGFSAAVREYKCDQIRGALAATGGNRAAAARRLDMDRSNLHHLAARLGLR